MKNIALWQVELTSPVAFFDQSVVEIIREPELIHVPYCHPLMHELLIGRDQWIPVLRLHETFECLLLLKTTGHEECQLLAVTALHYPNKIQITDENFVADASRLTPLFRNVSVSAVLVPASKEESGERILPVLNPSLLCTNEWLAIALSLNRKDTPIQ